MTLNSVLRKIAKRVFKIVYTNDLPENYAGTFNCLFVKIRPEYKDDKCLIEHEYTHAVQMLRTLGLHCLLYSLSSRYKLKSELEAYAIQYCCANERNETRLKRFAKFIATKYGLKIDTNDALRLLENAIKNHCPHLL